MNDKDLDDFTPKCVLFTGGCGFIGSNTLCYLIRRYPDTIWVNFDCLSYCGNRSNVAEICDLPNYRFVRGDLRAAEDLKNVFELYDFDCVMHFAAESHVDRSFVNAMAFIQSNVMGTQYLLEELIRSTKIRKFIHVSTDEVYGESSFLQGGIQMKEHMAMEPTNPYSASKAAAECLVKGYIKSFKVPGVIVRPNNVYGPKQYPEKLIPKSTTLFREGKQFPVHGTGTNKRSFLYVEDVARAFEVLLKNGRVGGVYNIATDCEKENLEVLRSVLQELGEDPNDSKHFRFVEDRFFNDRQYFTCGGKLGDLQWKPETSWEVGISKTVQWYKDHPDHFHLEPEVFQAHFSRVSELERRAPYLAVSRSPSIETSEER